MITRWKRYLAPAVDTLVSKPHPARPSTLPAYPPKFEVLAGLLSDIGCYRAVNEDFYRYIKPEKREKLEQKGILTLVCDGMGGHAGGEIASRLAAEIIVRTYYESMKPPQAALEEAFEMANRAVYKTARKQPRLHGMGTTSTAMVIHDAAVISAQVGDSRLYLVRSEQIYLMSEDHSAVMEMVRRGMMSLEEARCHEDKNIILRVVGVQPEVSVSTWKNSFPVRDGDCFVLCTDGLYDLVVDEEIKRTVSEHEAQSASQRLVALARERGGHDNITVCVIKICTDRTATIAEKANMPPTRELKPLPLRLRTETKE